LIFFGQSAYISRSNLFCELRGSKLLVV